MSDAPTSDKPNVVLASTLFDLEQDRRNPSSPLNARTWRTGIESLDDELPESLWRSNRVIGYAGSDGRVGGLTTAGSVSLPVQIIARHILDERVEDGVDGDLDVGVGADVAVRTGGEVDAEPAQSPTVFIIASPSQASSTIRSIHSALVGQLTQSLPDSTSKNNNNQPSKSKSDPTPTLNLQTPPTKSSTTATTTTTTPTKLSSTATKLLSTIRILPYLDLPSVLSCLSETTDLLPPTRPSILLLQSLSSTTTSTRRQTPLSSTALISRTMSSLNSLASSHTSCLILLDLDAGWTAPTSSTTSSRENYGIGNRNTKEGERTALQLGTAFTPTLGSRNVLTLSPGLAATTATATTAKEAEMMVRQCNRVIAVHDCDGRTGRDQRVVEVVKADEEELLGVWAVYG